MEMEKQDSEKIKVQKDDFFLRHLCESRTCRAEALCGKCHKRAKSVSGDMR